MPDAFFEWIWLLLFVVISTVHKVHERKAGQRASLKGVPILEALAMLLWGLAAGVLPLVYMFSQRLDFADWPVERPAALGVGGMALFGGAIWLLHRAHADLGRQWSPTVEFKENPVLVTEGAYKRIRHPMYAAHLLWGIAQALLIPNLLAGPLALILVAVVLVLRVPREERALDEQFGDAYRRYVERTGRFFPKALRSTKP